MDVFTFVKESKTLSTYEIYQHLAEVKCETDDEREAFLEFLPTLIKSTYSFFHSLDDDDVIFLKQAYENLKIFVKHASENITVKLDFKKLLHQWENAVNYYYLFMPLELFTKTTTNFESNYGLSKSKRTLKFAKNMQNQSVATDNVQRSRSDDLSRSFQQLQIKGLEINETEKQITISLLRLQVYIMKLFLLAHKKGSHLELLEIDDVKKSKNYFCLQTECSTNDRNFNVYEVLIFQDKEAKLSTKSITSQRSKISLTKYFCAFNQIRQHFNANQIRNYILFTNASADSMINKFFRSTKTETFLPDSFNKKGQLEYMLNVEESSDVFNILKNSIDMNYLIEKLIYYVLNDRKITLNASMLALYHTALINECIIDKNTSKFHASFIKGGESLTFEANIFRSAFFNALQEDQKLSENDAQKVIQNISLRFSDAFGKELRTCYTDFKIFSDASKVYEKVKFFVERFVLNLNQPNEDDLDKIVKSELNEKALLLNADFVNHNTLENAQQIINDSVNSNMIKRTSIEMIENLSKFSNQILKHTSKLDNYLPSYLQDKLSEFFKSSKLLLFITTSFPDITEKAVKKFDVNYVVLSLSLLELFLTDEKYQKKFLPPNYIIVRNDQKTINVKNEHLLQLFKFTNYKDGKRKAVIIVAEENLPINIAEKIKKNEKVELYDDQIKLENLFKENEKQIAKQYITFQCKRVLINKIIEESKEVCTVDLFEKILKNEEIVIENYSDLSNLYNPNLYISRALWTENGYKKESCSGEKLLSFYEKPMVIVGSSGIGKSTFLTKLAEQIRDNKDEIRWIVTIDLKNYCDFLDNLKFYENDEQKIFFHPSDSSSLDFGKVLLRSLLTDSIESEKISEEKLTFEKKLFKHYFYEEKLCILVDGFEQISYSHSRKLLQFFNKISDETNNILIIATTPDCENLLDNELDCKSYNLIPFTKEELKEYVRKYLEKNYMLPFENFEKIYEAVKKPIVYEQNLSTSHIPLFAWIRTDYFCSLYNVFGTGSEIDISVNNSLLNTVRCFIEIKTQISPNLQYHISSSNEKQIIYEVTAVLQLLYDLVPQAQKLFKMLNIDVENVEADILEKIEDFFFFHLINGKVTFVHSIFAEYFAASFLIKCLSQPQMCLSFELVNHLLPKASKAFEYFVLQLLEEKKQELRMILQNTTLLNFIVEKNYENFAKCLIATNYDLYYCFPLESSLNISALQTATEKQHGNFIEILITPYELEEKDEHCLRQNKLVKLKIIDYIYDMVVIEFYRRGEYGNFQELLYYSKKVIVSPDELEKASENIKVFVYSIGFMYDFVWTMQAINSNYIIEALKRRYDDYSLNAERNNITIHSGSRDIQQYTLLDLINKSDYYTDEEKQLAISALITCKGVDANWSYQKQQFDKDCSYITCLLEAAIVHDNIETFKHFLLNEKAENYYLLLLTAGKFSKNVFINYLLRNHFQLLINGCKNILFLFLESLSNEEIKNNLMRDFSEYKEILVNPIQLVKTAIDCSLKLSTIKYLWERSEKHVLNYDELKSLINCSLEHKRNDLAYYLNSQLEIPDTTEIRYNFNDFLLAEALIFYKGDINEPDDEGNTLLHYVKTNEDMARLLLTHGAMYNAMNKKYETPIDYVSAVTEVYDLLKETEKAFCLEIECYNEKNIASIFNTRNFKKQTLLHVVLEKGTDDKIKHVMETYIKKCGEYLPNIINAEDHQKIKPLHIAINNENFAVFKKLLSNGALFDDFAQELIQKNKNDINNKFKTFLQNIIKFKSFASFKDFLSLATLITEQPEDSDILLSCKDKNGKTVLHYLSEKNLLNVDLVKKISKLNFDINIVDINNNTPLDLKMMKSDDLQNFLNAGMKLSVCLPSNKINPDKNKLVLSYETYYEFILNDDSKGLQKAINEDIHFKLLMTANICDKRGNTLLHHAVKRNSYEIILLLLEYGVPYNVINVYGNSAETLAVDESIKNILHTIDDLFNAIESKKTVFLQNIASQAIKRKYFFNEETSKHIFCCAIQRHYDGNVYNVSTLLHKAVKHNKLDIVKWLIANGVDYNKTDFTGRNAMQIAKEEKNENIISYLQQYYPHQ